MGTIPRRALAFQDRAEADRLRTALADGCTTGLGQVLSGLGGVGKTQLAADFARTTWQRGELDVLVWVTATSRANIISTYAQTAAELLGADLEDPKRAAQELLAFLQPKSGSPRCRWLIVLDDVANPADVRGLWPPDSPLGRTLATTRSRDAAMVGHGRPLMPVGLFTSQEAINYLIETLALHDRAEELSDLAGLTADLGFLPLAMSQATAFMVDAAMHCSDYRLLLSGRRRKLADLLPAVDRLPDEQSVTVTAAWSLSVDRANAQHPSGLARPMLQLAATLDPNGIPQAALTGTPALAYLAAARNEPLDEIQAQETLRVLHRLNLIDHTPDVPYQAVRIHQLIQRATWDALSPEERAVVAGAAADGLQAAWPPVAVDGELGRVLRANVEVLTQVAGDYLMRQGLHPVLFVAGRSLGESGQVAAARDDFVHLAARSRQHLGPDHADTLTARSHLARWQGEAGDPAGALQAFAKLLPDLLRVLGPDHADTLTARGNLARWRGEAGGPAAAIEETTELLTDYLRVLGPDHRFTLTTRINLARWRGEAGDPAGAAQAFTDLLPDLLQVLGPDHPHTLTARHNLACWRGEAGDLEAAIEATTELVTDRVRVLGPDHPQTLAARGNVARWRGEAGDLAGAAQAFTELLPDLLRVLGPDHRDTLAARGNVARWRGEAGDPAWAVRAFTELLPDLLRVLGPDHPHTLIARYNFAHWRGRGGNPTGAAQAFYELLPDLLRVLGPDHPYVLAARNSLARWQGKTADPAKAAEGELLRDSPDST